MIQYLQHLLEKKKLWLVTLFSTTIILSLMLTMVDSVYGQAMSYRLRVFTFNGENNARANNEGVDVAVLNQETQAIRVHQFPSTLPPANSYFYFAGSEMPSGSTATVCAFYHGTTQSIKCTNIVVGTTGQAEYTSLDLS